MRLPDGASHLPGALKLWPYQREICDAIGSPDIERVTLVKSVRTGFTTLLLGATGYFCEAEPSPIITLLPTLADVRDFCVSDLEPFFDASPALRGVLSDDTPEGERNTLASKRFAGGSLKVLAARSPRNLRRHTARVLLIDEADACETGAEGNPLLLAERRTLSFANRKIIIGGTPTDVDTSSVLRSYAQSDKRVFEVPCPRCGSFHEIMWADIEWPEGEPQKARYRCQDCRSLIEEIHKHAMVEGGRWRPTAPEVQGHRGYRLNVLVSELPNASWGKIAQEFLVAKRGGPDLLKVFICTLLGQGWETEGETIDDAALISRVERFDLEHIPNSVIALTAGIDCGDDRLECSIVGWSRTNEAFVLAHEVIWGSFTDDLTWQELDALLAQSFKHPHGGAMRIDAAIVDCSDGDHTDQVLGFCAPRLRRRIFAGKGVAGVRPGFQMSKTNNQARRMVIVGVDGIKSSMFDKLARGSQLHFSDTLPPVYFEQLVGERRVTRMSRGRPVRRFERIGRARVEALDCLAYATAARQGVAINLDHREIELRENAPPAPKTVFRSQWMDR